MKNILTVVLVMSVMLMYAQKDNKPKVVKKNNLTHVTYYHTNGEVKQQGTLNADGKLHGEWKSYNSNGVKIAEANYSNGKKVGKWFFWNNNTLKEVDYNNSKIVNVKEWNSYTDLAVNENE